MIEKIIIDTGPLVAYLDRSDSLHPWARARLEEIAGPIWTCEAVVAEASFLLGRGGIDSSLLLEMIERGAVCLPFDLEAESKPVKKLMNRYHQIPMSLADACLVRMTELTGNTRIFTADSDFNVYRRHGRQLIPTMMPDSE